MIVKEYIKRFEKLGFGMFVHFGPYSVVGKGEYVKYMHKMPWEEYMTYVQKFIPKKHRQNVFHHKLFYCL